MLSPDQVDAFISGSLGPYLTITYAGDNANVTFTRENGDKIVAQIPASPHPSSAPFSIEKALSLPACGVEFERRDAEYLVTIEKRHQLWSTMKIALNHLHWMEESRIRFCFSGG